MMHTRMVLAVYVCLPSLFVLDDNDDKDDTVVDLPSTLIVIDTMMAKKIVISDNNTANDDTNTDVELLSWQWCGEMWIWMGQL